MLLNSILGFMREKKNEDHGLEDIVGQHTHFGLEICLLSFAVSMTL